MISEEDVVSEGFKPLRKLGTEPVALPSKPVMNRGMSFNAATGEKESAAKLWEASPWERMERNRGRSMDRSISFVGSGPTVETTAAQDGVIVIVDPFSTGAHLAAGVCRAGYKCARVLSAWDSPVAALVQKGLNIDFCASIQFNDRLDDQEMALNECVQALKDLPFPVLALMPGAETGVELADQLSHRLGIRSNGVEQSLARRNKYHMGETVRAAGVRAVKQSNCVTEEEVIKFLATLCGAENKSNFTMDNVRCVLKPVQSAGSDDVFLCTGKTEALQAFSRIFGTMNGLGLLNECVLCQEFLVGKEYVIDKVSRDGVHKLVGIWEYEKRPVNGAAFVYFGMRLKDPTTKMAQVMVAYADSVLNAVGIVHGPSHMEVMLNTLTDATTGEIEYLPCLVEVGARCQGGEGTWLSMARECVGYTQVEVTLDVYLEGKLFNTLAKDTYPKLKACREVDMVSRRGGIIRRLPGDAFIRNLPCFRGICWEVKPGDYIGKTIDCFTRPGSVQLVGDTEEKVEADFEAIHDIEPLGMIDYSVICPKPPSIGAVVVVDPFSSGANLAAMVLLWGYKLILVFSEQDSPVASLVTKGAKVEPTLLIQHDSTMADQDAAVAATLKSIEDQGSPILAIIPGAETGVSLADTLANNYGTRCNSQALTKARTDKYLMQEVLRSQGKIRCVQQQLCRSEQDVKDFLTKLSSSSPTGSVKCVVKPNESAGTDSVFLCETVEAAVKAYHSIHRQINGLGRLNEGALCQEFLSGTEYVVDGVSRDGVYKITAIWEYDKQSVNGANFVYFGMTLREATNDPCIRAVVEYARKVVAGLEIHQGPSHMEIISCEVPGTGTDADIQYSPCLVEVGMRCHGGEGSWLPVAMECVGYTMLDATLNCYLRADRFDALPAEPMLLKHGSEAFLVSRVSGTLKELPGLDEIRKFSSFRRVEMMTQLGSQISPTVDCFTRPGSVQLVNASSSKLQTDYAQIRRLEESGLFELV